jgi:hypothetical protein
VVLAGEGARADELARGLRERMTREVSQVGPGDLETACAAGICSGLLRSVPLPDILRPPVVMKKFRITRTHRLVAGGVLGFAGLILVFQMALSSRQGSLDRRREDLKALEPRAAVISRMSQQTALAHQWYRDRRDWIRVFDALCQSISRDKLWLTSATFEESGTVRLAGKAKDERQVTDFTAALKKTEPFKAFVIKIENRKHNPNPKDGYAEDFTVSVTPASAQPKRKK